MSDTLFLLGLLLPPAVVAAGFVALLAPTRSAASRPTVRSLRPNGVVRPLAR